VPADDALRRAQLRALETIISAEKDPRRANALSRRVTELEGAAPKS
jgi:hypothetical protein